MQGRNTEHIVTNNNATLPIGNYDIHCDGMYPDLRLTEPKQVSPDCASCLVESSITNLVRSYQSY